MKEEGWRIYIGKNTPDAKELQANSEPFDHFGEISGEAISAEILNTLSAPYMENPKSICDELRSYIDAAADYAPRLKLDLDPTKIRIKTIHLAIPEYTSPEQWRYLFAAIIYGKERGVRVVITRIRE